ncbi:hypothetical protein DFJ73DRAFT_757992 [Zopfochytrium polystomum]|nr:hypothetical protein DFJ73DRAFT_757992 [Zopfochytrium polystomum]
MAPGKVKKARILKNEALARRGELIDKDGFIDTLDAPPLPAAPKKRKRNSGGGNQQGGTAAKKHKTEPENYRVEDEKLPREFVRLMRLTKDLEEKKSSSKKKKSKDADGHSKEGDKYKNLKINEKDLKLRKGETIKAFKERVAGLIRNSVNRAMRRETKTYQKKKLFLKEKDGRRKTKSKDDEEEKRRLKPEPIPFGEQAKAPPNLTVIPKKVGGGAGAARAAAAALAAKEAKDKARESAAAKAALTEAGKSAGKKTKLRDLPMVQRKLRADERKAAIEMYRSMKQKQQSTLKLK